MKWEGNFAWKEKKDLVTVSHGVEGQLISEARIYIHSDIKALRQGLTLSL